MNAFAIEAEAHNGNEIIRLCFSTEAITVFDIGESHTFLERVLQPGNYEFEVFSDGKTYGKGKVSNGEIVLNNDDNALDDLLDYGFDGRTITCRTSKNPLASYPSEWKTVYTTTANQCFSDWRGYNDSDIVISLRDKLSELHVLLPIDTFKGDNVLPLGLEGTADDLKNKLKPLALGNVKNVTPVCCNTSKNIYAVSPPTTGKLDLIVWDSIANFDSVTNFFGSIVSGFADTDNVLDWDSIENFDRIPDFFGSRRSGIANVTAYDSALAFLNEADYVDENDMLTNPPSVSKVRVLPTHGYFRLGSTPAGLITCDCTDNSSSFHSCGSLTRGLLRDYLQFDSSKYNANDLSVLDNINPSELGYHTTANLYCDDLLDALFTSIGAVYVPDVNGVLRFFRIEDPKDKTPVLSFIGSDMKGVSRRNANDLPNKLVRLKQQKNWTVQTSDIAGAVTSEKRAWLSQESRENIAFSLTTSNKHLLSKELDYETFLVEDAQEETDRRLELFSVKRDILDIEFRQSFVRDTIDFSTLNIGSICSIDFEGRYKYNNKNMVLIGVRPDLANEQLKLTFWG